MKKFGSHVLFPLHLCREAGLRNPLLNIVVLLCLLTCESPPSFPCEVRLYCCFFACQLITGNFSPLLAVGLGKVEQPEISVSRATDESAQISCKVSINSFKSVAIYWYRQKPNQGLQFLLYVMVRQTYNQRTLDGKNTKIEVSKDRQTSTSILKVNFLKKEDEAIYYCAVWT
ncbi:T-cell receptor gamma chain V region V108B (Fragment) [Lemmus lemmus]